MLLSSYLLCDSIHLNFQKSCVKNNIMFSGKHSVTSLRLRQQTDVEVHISVGQQL